jgi:PAS domain S-box-containing protein
MYADPQERERFVAELRERGCVVHFQTTMRRMDCSVCPVSISARYLNEARDEPWLLLGTVEDISDLKRTELALRSSERKFSRAFHGSAGIFAITTLAEGRFIDVNARFLEITGLTREEIIGRTVFELGVWVDVAQSNQLHEQLLQHGTVTGFESRYRKKNGEIGHGLISAAIVDIDGTACLLTETVDMTAYKQTSEQLELLKRSIDESLDCAYWFDPQGEFVYANDAGCRALGYSREELMKLHVSDVNPRASRERWSEIWQALKSNGRLQLESVHRRKDGTTFPVALTSAYFRSGGREYCNGFAVDVTGQREAERQREVLQAQLLQAQKMESVGRLAGGVAHDFNNMLGVILGTAELALAHPNLDPELRSDLLEIQNAARRSADLTAQLLAFARKQKATPRVIDLNATVDGTLKMLRRLIGENICLVWQPGTAVWPTRIDPSQVAQMLTNLTVNARDAITGHGSIRIGTANATIAASQLSAECTVPGDYVQLTVGDDGCGLSAEARANLFEPFFTTKAVDKGTGLGLATVYGIVKQNGGFITVESEVSVGATFRIHLPRSSSADDVSILPLPTQKLEGGSELVLLVEDEPSLLNLARRMLERLGYRVLAANGPEEALRLVRSDDCAIDLLISDVLMPHMNGRELGAKLRDYCPEAAQLFMSGYERKSVAGEPMSADTSLFLQKPFTLEELATKVRAALRKRSSDATGHAGDGAS